MSSRAFPNLAVVRLHAHRAPESPGWLREEEAYSRFPKLTPAVVALMYSFGSMLAWSAEPAGQVWLRPTVGTWDDVQGAAESASRWGGG